MVIDKKKDSDKPRLNQGSSAAIAEPNKIAASTHFDFQGKNLTPYGGLFPVATMLERLGFEKLVKETLTVTRIPRVMTIYQFVLGWCWLFTWGLHASTTFVLWPRTRC